MKFLGLKRFQGSQFADVVRYLQQDVPKAILDMTTVLQAPRPVPRVGVVSSVQVAPWGGSISPQVISRITVPPGNWHLTGMAESIRGSSGANTQEFKIWLTTSLSATLPADVRLGYNYSVLTGTSATHVNVALACQWVLELKTETQVSLVGQATFSGGTPSVSGSIVAHGFTLE